MMFRVWNLVGSLLDATSNLVLKLRASKSALKSWSAKVSLDTYANIDRLLNEIQSLEQKEEFPPTFCHR